MPQPSIRGAVMIERIQQWLDKAMPTLIFIFAFAVGMKLGLWAQSAIIIWAIAHYAFRGDPSVDHLKQQMILLIIYAALMAYASLNTRQTLRKIEDICEEKAREDDDQCSRILWEIQDGGRSDYDYDQ